MKLLILYFDSFSLKENKITFLKRRASALIILAEILLYIICQVTRNILLARAHDQISIVKFNYQTMITYQRINRKTCVIKRYLRF